jgi:hypothetical protein
LGTFVPKGFAIYQRKMAAELRKNLKTNKIERIRKESGNKNGKKIFVLLDGIQTGQ